VPAHLQFFWPKKKILAERAEQNARVLQHQREERILSSMKVGLVTHPTCVTEFPTTSIGNAPASLARRRCHIAGGSCTSGSPTMSRLFPAASPSDAPIDRSAGRAGRRAIVRCTGLRRSGRSNRSSRLRKSAIHAESVAFGRYRARGCERTIDRANRRARRR
jgi:hypothetical protein